MHEVFDLVLNTYPCYCSLKVRVQLGHLVVFKLHTILSSWKIHPLKQKNEAKEHCGYMQDADAFGFGPSI